MDETGVSTPNLLDDPLLLAAPRLEFQGQTVPALGGIPLTRQLGQGGMGAVYRGYHARLNKAVAVKLLPVPLAKSRPQLLERFMREAQLASQIQSPHLITVLDVNHDSGIAYQVLELVDGMSARGLLDVKRETGALWLEERIALQICLAAAKGLAAAHAKGIVHRDVKPDNILVPVRDGGNGIDYDGAKLADLGLARGDDAGPSLTGSMDVMGTPGYMAPEQAMDSKGVGKACDVFGLGATLYALITGAAPFTGETTVQVVFATMNKAHVPATRQNPKISRATSLLLDHCLAKNPARRYADGAVLQQALQICLDTVDNAGNDAAQTKAMERLVYLINSTAQASSSGRGAAPVARMPQAETDELNAILKNKPRERTWVGGSGSFRRRYVIAVIVLMFGIWAFAFSSQRNAGLHTYGDERHETGLYQTIQDARRVKNTGDAEQIANAVLVLQDNIEHATPYDEIHMEEAHMLLSEMKQMQGKTGTQVRVQSNSTSTPVAEAKPAFSAGIENGEDGRPLTRVYSRPEELEGPKRLRQFAAPPSGRKLYALCDDRAAILVLDPETLTEVEQIPAAKNPVSIWCDETRIVAACDQSQVVAVMDAATHQTLKAIPIPETFKLTPIRVIGRQNGEWLVVCKETGRNEWKRMLLHVSENGSVRKALEGQIDWGFYLPGGKHFCAQRLGKGTYEKAILILQTETGRVESAYTQDLFRNGNGLSGAYSYIFQTADGRHAVLPYSRQESKHGFQAWTYLATADLKRVELDFPGIAVGEIANEGLIVSWGTVVEKNVHLSSRAPDVFYVSRSTGRVIRRVSPQNYSGPNNLHTTVLPERNVIFLPKQERLLFFGERSDGRVLSIRCGPVPEAAMVRPEANVIARGIPPTELQPGKRMEYSPQLSATTAGSALRFGSNPALQLREPPAGVSVDPASGRITWVPQPTQLGNHDFILEAAFEGGAIAPVQRFTVKVKQ